MEQKKEMVWKRADVTIKVPINDYLEEIIKTEKGPNDIWRVSVGTDSQKYGHRKYKFATVILIAVKEDMGGGVMKGKGGKMISSTFIQNTYTMNKEGVNERMLTEVSKSIEVAYEISATLDKHKIHMEIHADINPDPKWESNKALSQAVGYILGMGYEFKIKPNSWAASFAGDRFVK